MELTTYLLIVILRLSDSNASTIFVESKASWIKAHSGCNNRGGTLAYPNDINTCGNISNSKMWLGVTTQITKYGCYKKTEVSLIQDSLLKCYNHCNSSLFGFLDSRCSCIHNNTDTIPSESDSACRVAGDYPYLWLYNKTEKLSNSTTILNCMYVTCPDETSLTHIKPDHVLYTDDCSQQLDGYACLVHSPTNKMSVKPSLVNNIGTTIIEPLQTSYIPVQHGSTNMFKHLPQTDLRIKTSVPTQSTIGSSDMTVGRSIQNTLASSIISLSESSPLYYEYVATDMHQLSTINASMFKKSSSSVSTHAQPKNGSVILQTTVTSDLLTNYTRNPLARESIITSSIEPTPKHLQMPTTVYGSFATTTNTEELSRINMPNKVTMSSNSTRGHNNNTGRTSLKSTLGSSITTSPESSSSSTDMQHKSTVKTSMFRQSSSSVSIHEPSNVGSSILPTSVKSDLLSGHASKHVPSISVITSTISTTTKNFQIPTTVSFATITNKEELSKTNNMQSTTTMKSNSSGSHQNSTGLIVGVSVSVLVVLLIGVFGICRLRSQCPSKEKTDDYTIKSTDTKDPNYHDIDFDLHKDTHVIENDSKHPMLATKGADKQFLPTDYISNGKTNMSNNAYAVVVKRPSATNTTKVETNEDKNETKEISMHEDDYNMLNKLRPISGNESSNLYDTSRERLDVNDPTSNTTTHMHTKERELEPDYDYM